MFLISNIFLLNAKGNNITAKPSKGLLDALNTIPKKKKNKDTIVINKFKCIFV